MTREELLKPRYKVIADYPRSNFNIGDIWPDVAAEWTTKEQIDYTLEEMSKYPSLFKKLEWWEEREPEDMPEYLKHYDGEVVKVEAWTKDDYSIRPKYWGILAFEDHGLLPATKEEFDIYSTQVK